MVLSPHVLDISVMLLGNNRAQYLAPLQWNAVGCGRVARITTESGNGGATLIGLPNVFF
jgi:hypothetical protein